MTPAVYAVRGRLRVGPTLLPHSGGCLGRGRSPHPPFANVPMLRPEPPHLGHLGTRKTSYAPARHVLPEAIEEARSLHAATWSCMNSRSACPYLRSASSVLTSERRDSWCRGRPWEPPSSFMVRRPGAVRCSCEWTRGLRALVFVPAREQAHRRQALGEPSGGSRRRATAAFLRWSEAPQGSSDRRRTVVTPYGCASLQRTARRAACAKW